MPLDPATVKFLQYAAWGLLGGVIGAMSRSRKLEFPVIYLERKDGRKRPVFEPGFIAAPLLGSLLAGIIDGRPETAVAYGLASGYAGPALITAIVDPLLKKAASLFGVTVTVPPQGQEGSS